MAKIRLGFRYMWQAAPVQMERAKAKRPGEYNPKNHHAGVCWGYPGECTMTNLRASKVLRACIKSKMLTIDQIKVVRKSLAYAFELKGGRYGENFPCVKGIMVTIKASELHPKKRDTNPVNIPTPVQLKQAFVREWSPTNVWHFVPWCLGLLTAYDCHIWGSRAQKDHDKIKKATEHKFNWKQGWQASKYHGGRAKLIGPKKGTRVWWVYRVCMCPGNKHVRPPADFFSEIDKNGDPRCGRIGFCSTCPLACWEVIMQLQFKEDEPKRNYPKWLEPSKKLPGRLGNSNINDVAKFANEWMEKAQEVGKFDHNSGRKTLAKWVGYLKIPYCESVHIHGDLHAVWGKNYQQDVPTSVYSIREQSKDPAVATKAARKLAKWFGKGLPYEQRLNTSDRYMDSVLRALGKHKRADTIKYGMPSDDEESEESDEKMQARPRKRKRRERSGNGISLMGVSPTPPVPPMPGIKDEEGEEETVEPQNIKKEED